MLTERPSSGHLPMAPTVQSCPYYPVLGRKDTEIFAPRLSIEELQHNEEQFTLFILSLLFIQDRGSSIVPGPTPTPGVGATSYFNISAIHGKPYQRWPGDHEELHTDFNRDDPKDTNPVPSRFGGYCNHGSVLFPTWHRPYVMLIEQAIGVQAMDFARAFDDIEGNTRWIDAATQLRFPYWDWASPTVEEEGMPSVLYEEEVTIIVPGSLDPVNVPNPLAMYPIGEIPSDFTDEVDDENMKSYFTKWKTTLRHPRSEINAEKSRIQEMQRELKSRVSDLRSKVVGLFTFGEDEDTARVWDEFSNHSPVAISKSSQAYHGSLEGVHDSLHDILGGLGHMSFPDYAAFDPIFYLHHCNIDRLYALWEYCYRHEEESESYWMGEGYQQTMKSGLTKIIPWTQPQGTYSKVYNAQILPDSPLAPFRKSNGEYWTASEVRYLDKSAAVPKYYTYHTLGIAVEEDAPKEQRREARRIVQEYYNYKPQPRVRPGGLFGRTHADVPKCLEVVKGHRQFVVSVELLEHAFNGPYSFKLYTKGPFGPKVVGAVSVFARPDHSPCAACAGHRVNGSTVRGAIFIDEEIVTDVIDGCECETNVTTDVAVGLKKLLHAELTSPEGNKLGVTSASHEYLDEFASESQVPMVVAPISVTLLSAAAVRRNDVDGRPVSWVDWRDHGEVFSGGSRYWTNQSMHAMASTKASILKEF